MKVSGITVVFALACAVVPGLVRMAIQHLGSAGQLTDCPEAARLRDPTMFAPSDKASGVRGPFNDESRGWSAQVWIMRHRASLTASGLAVAAACLLALRFHH